MKKYPDSVLLKVCIRLIQSLKAIALTRLGREDEAKLLVEPLASISVTEDRILHALSLALRSLDKRMLSLRVDEELLNLYDQCWKNHPGSEELGVQTFFSASRVKDYKRQQQIALKLFKAHPNAKYLFWAIMSVLLQGNCEPGDPKLFYSLAKKMAEKAIAENQLKTVEEIHLLVAILLENEDFSGAIDILKGELGNLFTNEVEKALLLCELYRKVEMWAEIEELGQKMILEEKLALLIDYIASFGSKDVCFYDIRFYLEKLVDEEIGKLFAAAKIDWSLESCILSLTWLKVIRFIRGSAIESSSKLEESDRLMGLYLKMSESVEKIAAKRMQDDLLILSVYCLLDVYEGRGPAELSGSVSVLTRALALMERGLSENPYNFEFKLLAIRLYEVMGVFKRAQELFKSLEIKHIQLDTFSYIISDVASLLGFFDDSIILAIENLVIYQSNRRETPEMVVQAYRYGTFSKITEFIVFWEKLEFSLQRLVASRELMRLEILKNITDCVELVSYLGNLNSENVPFFDSIPEVIHDNRDKEVVNFDTCLKTASKFALFDVLDDKKVVWFHVHCYIPRLLKSYCSVDQIDRTRALLQEFEKSLDPIEPQGLSDRGALNVSKFFVACLKEFLELNSTKNDVDPSLVLDLEKDISKFGTQTLGEQMSLEFYDGLMQLIEKCHYVLVISGIFLSRFPAKSRKAFLKENNLGKLIHAVEASLESLQNVLETITQRLNQDLGVLFQEISGCATIESVDASATEKMVAENWKMSLKGYHELVESRLLFLRNMK